MDAEMKQVQIEKLRAEIRHLTAQSNKLMVETRWYPLVIATGLVGAIIAFTKLFL